MKALANSRLRVVIRGAVQGVGFRPFVFRLATELGLAGWVLNSPQGVRLEVEGPADRLHQFLVRLSAEKPAPARIQSLEPVWLDPAGYAGFEIRASEAGPRTATVAPDIATCPDCLAELFDHRNRRYLYPFINCTHCGPRFSLIESIPYDRPATTMKRFGLCAACRSEYENPADRRFHAQPNACHECGPWLEFWDREGRVRGTHQMALYQAAEALREGLIVAVKGIGGFQLWVDARRERTIRALRQRKHRQEKPFALMVPSIEWARALCRVSPLEERALLSPEAPIVLMRRRRDPESLSGFVAESVAPHHPALGLLMPYAPLHHLLLAEFPHPVVATSGNFSEEPICTDERQALLELGDLADVFLVHNRPIARPVDDSVVRVVDQRELLIRRARGYAPLPVAVGGVLPPVLGVGGQLKNSIAVPVGGEIFLSQAIGDLDTVRAFDTFRQTIQSFRQLYNLNFTAIARDAHPGYRSTRYAEDSGLPEVVVQHHYAHVLSCMADNGLEGPVLGLAWDGTGYGTDGTIWGGEFLEVGPEAGFKRLAHLRTFRLPGGDAAVREPRRSALGLLFEIFGERLFELDDLLPLRAFTPADLAILKHALQKGLQAPVTSSMGRLFDAVASIIGLRQQMRYEGQAAMQLEYAAEDFATEERYPFNVTTETPGPRPEALGPRHESRENPPRASGLGPDAPLVLDWEPMVRQIVVDRVEACAPGLVSARFHNTIIEMAVAVARQAGRERVCLSGGCFQNRWLSERLCRRLRAEGFRPYPHQRVPPNDGGIALGQVLAAARALREPAEPLFSRNHQS